MYSYCYVVVKCKSVLHPLRPQNKQLHTQRITDYKHTGQRRIQKEMASTHTKNATKQNSFKILQLQTARKKINWTTLKTLERATITLQTERIKGSNPWCL